MNYNNINNKSNYNNKNKSQIKPKIILKRKKFLIIFLALLFIISYICATTKSSLALGIANEAVPAKKKLVALTFDDGPSPKYTEDILKVLEKHNVQATFFVVGLNVIKYPELIIKEAQLGHEIGNHTYTHMRFGDDNIREIMEEVDRTDDAIFELIGERTKLLRPPYGVCTESVIKTASEGEYSIVLWNVDTKDWTGRSCEKIVETVKKNVKNGDIVLFHDYIVNKGHNVQALDILIPWLKEQGYEFVTVSQLLAEKYPVSS